MARVDRGKAFVHIGTVPTIYGRDKIESRWKKEKKCTKSVKLDILPFSRDMGNKFRTAALAVKFQRAMNVTSQANNIHRDIEDQKSCLMITEYSKGKFKKVVETIIVMIKVIKVFSAHASDTGRPVLIAQLNNCREDQIPQHPKYFKPRHFALKKFRYHIDPEARRILQQPWNSRTPDMVVRVSRALRHCKAFRNMTESMQLTMAKYARYESHQSHRTIVRKGDPGRHYYFIFSGQVMCMDSDVSDLDSAVVLGPGDDFGHVALLHMEKRTATISCTEDTEFIVLDRRGNERAVYRALHKEHKQKRQFLASLDMFEGLDSKDYKGLADHARISEYLPTSLIATVDAGHPTLYIIMEGTANVALKTDLYSCCQPEDLARAQYNEKQRKAQCKHNKELLHDTFTQHDPTITCVIQRLSEKQIFGVQHVFHKQAKLPTLHLIAKSRVTVVSLPVFSVRHYATHMAIMNLQERYPVYPSIPDLVCEYMESSQWELYKADIIRELLHPEGRVDPRKRCKYCISCQLRSLVLPSILHDTLRHEVSDLYCPGHVSHLPALAKTAFRPKSAPPHYSKPKKGAFRSYNPSPNLRTPDLPERSGSARVLRDESRSGSARVVRDESRAGVLRDDSRACVIKNESRVSVVISQLSAERIGRTSRISFSDGTYMFRRQEDN